jgi:pantetheine-phosphate adenylyltransferase
MALKARTVVYPGTFDPVTNGHLDIIQRASHIFDHVIVALAVNSHKTPIFSVDERREMLETALKAEIRRGKVSVDAFEGLLVHYVRKRGAVAIVRGLRAVSDFEYEFQMALMNRHQSSEVETVFLMPDEKYTYLSSTLLREIVRLGGDIRRFVPVSLASRIRKKLHF